MTDPSAVWDRIGGHEGVRRLVDAFYDVMDASPDLVTLRAMHPTGLAGSRERLTLFLTFRLGGDTTYLERRGHPRLRGRHLPFPIGADDAAAWMRCMDRALAQTVSDEEARDVLRAFFAQVAEHMRNR